MVADIIQMTQQSLWLVLIMAAPPVFAAAIVGLLIAFLQAATQLQEQTFQYAIKFVVVVLAIFLTSSLLGGSIYHYTDMVFNQFPSY